MAVRLPNGHTHTLQTITSVARDHVHGAVTTTDRAVVLCNGQHIHRIKTLTTFDALHAHAVWTWTGPGIPIGNGRHIHRVHARTTLVFEHRHLVHDHTAAAPNIPAAIVRRVRLHCLREC